MSVVTTFYCDRCGAETPKHCEQSVHIENPQCSSPAGYVSWWIKRGDWCAQCSEDLKNHILNFFAKRRDV